jgi:hypothetical protein
MALCLPKIRGNGFAGAPGLIALARERSSKSRLEAEK